MTTPCTAAHTWTWGSSPGEFNYRIEPGTPCDCGAVVWEKPKTSVVAEVASALALAILQESLAAGKSIEIPALGIVIEPALVRPVGDEGQEVSE